MNESRGTTRDVLAILTDRIMDLCLEIGRPDLAEAVSLLEKVASGLGTLETERAKIIDLLAGDDLIVQAGEAITSYQDEVARAYAERQQSSVQ
ncbi:hypothetical protein J4G43_004925 [Bradyrhizobium barranii subsp. barranii]|uniref:Uncharacterized protein n=1 Tax=Bradyrhizobium barranii subsp. barranii TaxID=2823807 RepID=A0A939RWH2_9BRAD|nr:hypothetical protein [Bradyrhizobium barranii]UEM13667.1 hypothetical protein J4G43_004925 [Bradyrhizobium barranii subsp. barranii]